MSSHPIPAASDSQRLRDLVSAALREATNVTANGQPAGTLAFVFVPDLTAGEQALFDDIVAAAKGTLRLDMADYSKIKAQKAELTAFMSGSPTATQTRDAVRAVIRVLNAILRD